MTEVKMANIPLEGEVVISPKDVNPDNKEKETPATPPSENKPKEEKAASSEAAPVEGNTQNDNNVPFHKRPEFQSLKSAQEERYKKFMEEQETKMKERFANLQQQYESKPQTITVPKWFENLYGDNPEAWAEYQKATQNEREQMKAEIIKEFQKEREQTVEYEKTLDNWVEQNLNTIVEFATKNGLPDFNKNEFMKIMVDYAPSDEQGNLDFGKGYELYSKLKSIEQAKAKEKSDAKKELAGAITGRSKGEAPKKDYMTQDDFRGKSMWEIVKG